MSRPTKLSFLFISLLFLLISLKCFLILLLWSGMLKKWNTVTEPQDPRDSRDPWNLFHLQDPTGPPEPLQTLRISLGSPLLLGNVMRGKDLSGINFSYLRNRNFSIIKFSQFFWSVLVWSQFLVRTFQFLVMINKIKIFCI